MLTQEKQQRFLEAGKELFARKEPVKFELDMAHTVGLISQLQLAFRHPENTGPTSEFLKKFVIDLIEKIDPSRGDAYDFLMHGFNQAYDAIKCKNCEKMAAVIDGKCEYCGKPLSLNEQEPLDWEKAWSHFCEIRGYYQELAGTPGVNSELALMLTFRPLAARYEKGERTEELYQELISVE